MTPAQSPMLQQQPADGQGSGIPQEVQADQEAVQKIVLSCLTVMYDPKTFPIFKQGLSSGKPIPDILAMETAGLIRMVDDRTQHNLPKKLLPMVAVIVLMEMAKFMSDAGIGRPSEEDIKAAIVKALNMLTGIYRDLAQQRRQGQQPPTGQSVPDAAQGGLIQQAQAQGV